MFREWLNHIIILPAKFIIPAAKKKHCARSSFQRARRILCIILFFCLFAPCLFSQQQPLDTGIPSSNLPGLNLPTDPITATVIVGVDPERHYRREESWVPMIIELENHKEAVKGDLIVRMKDGIVEYSVPVNLPAKAKKSYDLTVFFPQMLDELEFYIDDGRKEIQIEIVTVPTTYAETDRFIAVISPERGSHDHFAHRPEDEETDLFRRVMYTTPAFLPQYSIGYQSLDVLLWDGGSTASMSPEQDAALESWIQMGGTLILAAGEYWQELNTSPFRLYTPMTLNGSRVLSAGTKLDNPGESVQPTLLSSQVIATGEILDDPKIHVWLKAGDDPFLIERKWGAGRIVFVASSVNNQVFDHPILQTIFKDFLSQSYLPLSAKIAGSLDENITWFLRKIIQAELPGTWFIAIYLGCYILLVVPINYIVFRAIGRLEWAWFTVPIWAIIFAYGAYYIGALRQQGQVAMNQICIVEARPSASTAQSTSYCSIYSPVRKHYEIEFEDPVAFPQLLQGNTGQRNNTLSEEGLQVQYNKDSSQVNQFIIYHWSQRSLKTQHAAKIGNGIDMDLQWSNNHITGSITNNTGFTLNSPTIYVKKHEFDLDDTQIQDGETCLVDKDITVARMSTPRAPMMNVRPNLKEIDQFVQNELKQAYAQQFRSSYPSLGMAVLAARVDKTQLTFKMNGNLIVPKEGQTLLCQVFPLKEKIQGRLLLQNDAWEFTNQSYRSGDNSRPIPGNFRQGRGMGGGMGYGMMQGNMNTRITEFQTPQNSVNLWDINSDISLAGCKIDSFSINVNYERLGFVRPRRPNGQAAGYELVNGKPSDSKYELHVEDLYERKYHPLSEITNEEGEIVNPGRYVDKVTGVISARIESPLNSGLMINLNAIEIRLLINYGTEAGGKFLGYFVDAVAEDASLTSTDSE